MSHVLSAARTITSTWPWPKHGVQVVTSKRNSSTLFAGKWLRALDSNQATKGRDPLSHRAIDPAPAPTSKQRQLGPHADRCEARDRAGVELTLDRCESLSFVLP